MQHPITEEAIRLTYKLLLNRDPESDTVIADLMQLDDIETLRRHFMDSAEFKSKIRGMCLFPHSKWVATEVLGMYTQWIDLNDRFVSQGCLDGSWEASETAWFSNRIAHGDTVLDIGANVGWFTLLAAKFGGRHAEIHAFEPRPDTARMLKRTISDNGLRDQVHVWEYALSNQWAELELCWSDTAGNPGNSFLATTASRGAPAGKATVFTAILDEFLPEVAPDIVKIDVEGAEPLVFMGATNAIKRKRPPILSELFPAQLEMVAGVSAKDYIDMMASFGYRCYLLEDGKLTHRISDYPESAGRRPVSVVFERTGASA